MASNLILKCAIRGCQNLHDRIRAAQLEAGLEPVGIGREGSYFKERLFQYETGIEIMHRMRLDVEFDVYEPESNKNVDFILKTDDRPCYVGEAKLWKLDDESEFWPTGIIRELNILERVNSAAIFYLIFTIHIRENRHSNIEWLNEMLEKHSDRKYYNLESDYFEINKKRGELFEVFYVDKTNTVQRTITAAP